MNRISLPLCLITTLLVLSICTAPVQAQASRTWVSGVGDDANPCSRVAPCKTFAGAISKTAPGGEIDALDPGGFGAVTITKAMTIDGGGGQVASVLVAGTNGIVVLAGANDTVTLRNLRVHGIGAGINGIRFLSGASLVVENCEIFGFTAAAINVAPSAGGRVFVSKSTLTNNLNGIFADASGGSSAAVIKIAVTETKAANNSANGIVAFSIAGHACGCGNVRPSNSRALRSVLHCSGRRDEAMRHCPTASSRGGGRRDRRWGLYGSGQRRNRHEDHPCVHRAGDRLGRTRVTMVQAVRGR